MSKDIDRTARRSAAAAYFGEALRLRRIGAGLSRAELSSEARVSEDDYVALETGTVEDRDVLDAVVFVLDRQLGRSPDPFGEARTRIAEASADGARLLAMFDAAAGLGLEDAFMVSVETLACELMKSHVATVPLFDEEDLDEAMSGISSAV